MFNLALKMAFSHPLRSGCLPCRSNLDTLPLLHQKDENVSSDQKYAAKSIPP